MNILMDAHTKLHIQQLSARGKGKDGSAQYTKKVWPVRYTGLNDYQLDCLQVGIMAQPAEWQYNLTLTI
jgi:hypothetical protein